MSVPKKIIPILTLILCLIVGCGQDKPGGTQAGTAELPKTATLSSAYPSTEEPGLIPTPTVYLDCTALYPESIERQVERDVNQGLNMGIVVGIVSPCGREIHAYGYTDLSASQKVNENTVFEIGSIGKVFTALLLADMVEHQEISLYNRIWLDPTKKIKGHNVRP